jgi:hypothetical protein
VESAADGLFHDGSTGLARQPRDLQEERKFGGAELEPSLGWLMTRQAAA